MSVCWGLGIFQGAQMGYDLFSKEFFCLNSEHCLFFLLFNRCQHAHKTDNIKKNTDKDVESDTSIPKHKNTHKHSVRNHFFVAFTVLSRHESDAFSHDKHPELSILSVEIRVQTGSTLKHCQHEQESNL